MLSRHIHTTPVPQRQVPIWKLKTSRSLCARNSCYFAVLGKLFDTITLADQSEWWSCRHDGVDDWRSMIMVCSEQKKLTSGLMTCAAIITTSLSMWICVLTGNQRRQRDSAREREKQLSQFPAQWCGFRDSSVLWEHENLACPMSGCWLHYNNNRRDHGARETEWKRDRELY